MVAMVTELERDKDSFWPSVLLHVGLKAMPTCKSGKSSHGCMHGFNFSVDIQFASLCTRFWDDILVTGSSTCKDHSHCMAVQLFLGFRKAKCGHGVQIWE